MTKYFHGAKKLSLRCILKLFLNFTKFESQDSYILYFYKKKLCSENNYNLQK